jgi:hypothetical protein
VARSFFGVANTFFWCVRSFFIPWQLSGEGMNKTQIKCICHTFIWPCHPFKWPCRIFCGNVIFSCGKYIF